MKHTVVPEAQFPSAVPPFVVHSLAVKQVPVIEFDCVDDLKVHSLKSIFESSLVELQFITQGPKLAKHTVGKNI
jgi:hypothetical protein